MVVVRRIDTSASILVQVPRVSGRYRGRRPPERVRARIVEGTTVVVANIHWRPSGIQVRLIRAINRVESSEFASRSVTGRETPLLRTDRARGLATVTRHASASPSCSGSFSVLLASVIWLIVLFSFRIYLLNNIGPCGAISGDRMSLPLIKMAPRGGCQHSKSLERVNPTNRLEWPLRCHFCNPLTGIVIILYWATLISNVDTIIIAHKNWLCLVLFMKAFRE